MDVTGKVKIAGALHSIDNTGIVAYTGDLHDAYLGMRQSEINKLITEDLEYIKENGTPSTGGTDFPHVFMSPQEYDSIEIDPNVTYFIYEDEESEPDKPTTGDSVIDENILKIAAILNDTVLTVSGTMTNSVLTI